MNTVEYKNIPQGGVLVLSQERREEKVSVNFFQRGIIKLSGFALMQLLHGSELLCKEDSLQTMKGFTVTSAFKALSLLSSCLLTMQVSDFGAEHTIEITRDDLKMFKLFLETRMKHCENERDVRSESFNPDTYIGQKLLLIDIREMLLGDINY